MACWKSKTGIRNHLKLPSVTATFANSDKWKQQLAVIELDLSRTPHIDHGNATRIMLRYACNMPTFGYSQGNLYILRPVLHVYRDEASAFWVFARMMDMVNVFGPMNRDVGFRQSGIPSWVTDEFMRHEPSMDMEWLQLAIQLRWMYVMWGQTCKTLEIQCALIDYAISGRNHMYQLTAAMLRRFYPRVEKTTDVMATFKAVFEIQIQTPEEAAFIIAAAATQFPQSNHEHRRRLWRLRPR